MPKLNGLSPKQKKFVAAYLKTDNATKAAKIAYPNQTTSAYQQGYENLRKPEIKGIIANHMLKHDVTIENVLKVLADELESPDAMYRLKAAELAGKYLKMYTDKVDHTVVLDRVKAIGWSSGKEAKDEVIEVIPTQEK